MQKKQILNPQLKLLLQVVATLLITYLVVRFVAAKTVVEGVSMYPTLTDKECVLIDKLTYRTESPERFDIVVFEEDISDTGYYIKRIIGLPGEEVTIDKRGNIYINGKVLRDSYGYGVIADPGIAVDTVTVGDGEYFVMGDNRNNSTDSRFEEIGNVSMDQIVGKVALRIWPINRFGYIDLYMERMR